MSSYRLSATFALILMLCVSGCGEKSEKISIQELRSKESGVLVDITMDLSGVVRDKIRELHGLIKNNMRTKGLPTGYTRVQKGKIVFHYSERKDFAKVKDFFGSQLQVDEKTASGIIQYNFNIYISETRSRYSIFLTLNSTGHASIVKPVNGAVIQTVKHRLKDMKAKKVIVERVSVRRIVVFVAGVHDKEKVYQRLRNNYQLRLALVKKAARKPAAVKKPVPANAGDKSGKAAKNGKPETNPANESDVDKISAGDNTDYELVTGILLDNNSVDATIKVSPKKPTPSGYQVAFTLNERARKILRASLAKLPKRVAPKLALVRDDYSTSLVQEGEKSLVDVSMKSQIFRLLPVSMVDDGILLQKLTQQEATFYSSRMKTAQYPVPIHVTRDSVIVTRKIQ